MHKRILTEFRKGVGPDKLPPSVMEIHAAAALTRVIERFAQRREVRETPRLSVEGGSGAGGSQVGYDRVVPVEQAFTLVTKSRPKGAAEMPAWSQAGL
jgi:hypothetical protein